MAGLLVLLLVATAGVGWYFSGIAIVPNHGSGGGSDLVLATHQHNGNPTVVLRTASPAR